MKKEFKFTIEVPSDNYTFELPLIDVTGVSHNFTVDWGDGTQSQVTAYNDDANRTKTYALAGNYTVEIDGVCPGFKVNYNLNNRTIYRSVDSWGDVGFIYINFEGCTNLKTLPENSKGLKEVRSFYQCFRYCKSLTSIPENLFKYNIRAANFEECFYGCSSLTLIPENLFKYNTKAMDFERCFDNCENLTSIPENLFPKK